MTDQDEPVKLVCTACALYRSRHVKRGDTIEVPNPRIARALLSTNRFAPVGTDDAGKAKKAEADAKKAEADAKKAEAKS